MRYFKRVLFSSCLLTSIAMAEEQKTQQEQFVESLDEQCTYTDGYQCHQSDPSFYSKEALQSLVPAVYLPAWAAAYQTFQSLPDLTAEQKLLKHYKVGFAEQDGHIVVLLTPLFLPYFSDDGPYGVSTGVVGQAMKIWVDKQSLTVSKHIYLR